jgi:hypothetical protein
VELLATWQLEERAVIDLKALEAMVQRATPPEWYTYYAYKGKDAKDGNLIAATAPGHQVRTTAHGGTMPSADLEAIAALHNAAPALIAALRLAVEALREIDASDSEAPHFKGALSTKAHDALARIAEKVTT